MDGNSYRLISRTTLRVTISSCVTDNGSHTIATALAGGRPGVYGIGLNVRDWTHVDDHCSAVWAILTRGAVGESYVVGADCERTNLEVVGEVLRVPGWVPEHTDFSAKIAALVAWYRGHPTV